MCLDAYHDEVKIATTDITVYKVLVRKSNSIFISPYRGEFYEFNEIKEAQLHARKSFIASWALSKELTIVEEGLHSFKHKHEAFMIKTSNHVVIKCTIPAGSEYYEGSFGPYESYASSALVVGKRTSYNWVPLWFYKFFKK